MAANYRVELTVTDHRGTVMEGLSGSVGPEMFANADPGGPGSYECAQPLLRIYDGGRLVLAENAHRIVGGVLWLDRQMEFN